METAAVSAPQQPLPSISTTTTHNHNNQHQPNEQQQPKKTSKPKNAHALLKTLPPPPTALKDNKTGKTYTTGEWLGEGGFARCYHVSNEKGDRLACKVVAKISLKSQKQKQKLFGEIRVHRSLHHKHIVKFHEVFEDDHNVYMILELCENRTFVDFLRKRRRLTEPEVRFYMFQLLDAVGYMHSMRVIHRDLKLGNLFISREMDLKIGDFGLAANIKHDGERKRTICGTPNYIAPEVLFDTQNGHSFEVDIWSLGVIMYTMLFGRPPFQTKEVDAIYKRIKENSYEFPSNIEVSEDAKDMIKSLLHSRPECRPMVKDIMSHPFLKRGVFPRNIPVSALQSIPTLEDVSSLRAPLSNARGHQVNRVVSMIDSTRNKNQGDLKPMGRSNMSNRAPLPGNWMKGAPEEPSPMVSSGTHQPHQRDPSPVQENMNVGNNVPKLMIKLAIPPNNIGQNNNYSPMEQQHLFTSEENNIPPNAHGHLVQEMNLHLAGSGQSRHHLQIDTQKSNQGLADMHSVRSGKPSASPNHMFTPNSYTASPNTPQSNGVSSGKTPIDGLVQQMQNHNISSPSDSSTSFKKSQKALYQLHETLAKGLSDLKAGKIPQYYPTPEPVVLESKEIKNFVSKWIDYSNKYGLGYQLVDGSVGVYFNDGTSIILSNDGSHFEYINVEKVHDSAKLVRNPHTLDVYPKELRKKVTLLKHFKGYMQENLHKICTDGQQESRTTGLDFITKYLRTKHGVIFRLSNQVFQINLFDHTKIIISQSGHQVTFINNQRELKTQSLDYILASGQKEIIDRLKFARDTIYMMMNKSKDLEIRHFPKDK